MNDQRVINLLQNTPNIVKVGKNPKDRFVLPQMDIDRVFKKTNNTQNNKNAQNVFVVGNTIKIKEGCFAGFYGKIISVDTKTQSLLLTVSVFSRDTEVRVTFSDVEIF